MNMVQRKYLHNLRAYKSGTSVIVSCNSVKHIMKGTSGTS